MVTNNTAKASSSVAVSAKSRGSRAMGNGSNVNSIGGGSIRAPGFRLGDGGGDHCDTVSSVSRNSIYKLKIDAMFDDTRSVVSVMRPDDRASTRHGRSVIDGGSVRSMTQHRTISVRSSNATTTDDGHRSHDQRYLVDFDVQQVSNKVQDQIERMFTDVIKDVTSCSFAVKCLGSLPLAEKVTSLLGLQEPLRQLYLSGAGHGTHTAGNLDICASGIRVRLPNGQYAQMTPFHNIAVWSAVKFVVSPADGGAAFLPLITDPDNIDKSSLFIPLSASDKRRLSSGLHSPIFAVVMRSLDVQRQLECHAFVCQSPEDAIVIAATLYQSLMTHMDTSQTRKSRKPRNQNGVSCVSIASSSVGMAGGQQLIEANVHNKASVAAARTSGRQSGGGAGNAPRPHQRKKRSANGSLNGNNDFLAEGFSHQNVSTAELKKKSHKTRRAPPIPVNGSVSDDSHTIATNTRNKSTSDTGYQGSDANGGDIFTRVAIPRSGSFLNTSGLTRYKSRATRRAAGKNGAGGGGGSPLGFSELFNEFRLQENLHSLDDILNAIINFDGMSFNDLKPIYKEFLLKLAVTLTKDELYQRSKSIMRRQKKKKLRRKNSTAQKPSRKSYILGSKSLSKVFWFGKYHISKFNRSKLAKIDLKAKSIAKDLQQRTGTSGSDVSDVRNEMTLNGQNRNSSSGYVSCSECSYDSEACTCASADRCYCSLVIDHDRVTDKLHKTTLTHRHHQRRHSLLSCGTDDKCYCSLGERTDGHSSTSWCDSDSCISNTKCYCKAKRDSAAIDTGDDYTPDNLALDYELFTIDNARRGAKPSSNQMRANEALSAKKSVEMAALFADFKLTQTTDIKNMLKTGAQSITPSYSSSSNSSSRKNKGQSLSSSPDSLNGSRSVSLKKGMMHRMKEETLGEEIYQTMPQQPRPVSATLEDSLGYLP